MRDQARARKLDTDAARGKAGVQVGRQEAQSQPVTEVALGAAEDPPWRPTDVNIFNTCKDKGKGKGKGNGKGKGKGDQS